MRYSTSIKRLIDGTWMMKKQLYSKRITPRKPMSEGAIITGVPDKWFLPFQPLLEKGYDIMGFRRTVSKILKGV